MTAVLSQSSQQSAKMLVAYALTHFQEVLEHKEYERAYGADVRSALASRPDRLAERFNTLHARLFPVEFADRHQSGSLDRAFRAQTLSNADQSKVTEALTQLATALVSGGDARSQAGAIARAYHQVYRLQPYGPSGTMVAMDALLSELAEAGVIRYDIRNLTSQQLQERRTLLEASRLDQRTLATLTSLFEVALAPAQTTDLAADEAVEPLPYRMTREEMGENFESIARRPLPGQSERIAFGAGEFRMLTISNPQTHTRQANGQWTSRDLHGTYVVLADGGLVELETFRALAGNAQSPSDLRVRRRDIQEYLMRGPVAEGTLLNAPNGGRGQHYENRPDVDGVPLAGGVPAISLDVDWYTNLTIKTELKALKDLAKNLGNADAGALREGANPNASLCGRIYQALVDRLPHIAGYPDREQAVWEALVADKSPLRDNLMVLMLGDRAFAQTVAAQLPQQAALVEKAAERLQHTAPILWKEFTLQMHRGQLGEELSGERRTQDGKPLFVVTAGPSAAGKTTSIEAMTFLLGAEPGVQGSKELFNQAYVFSGLDRGRQLLDVHTQVRAWVDGNHDYPDTSYIGDISRNVLLELGKCCRFNIVRDGSGVPSYKTEEMIQQVHAITQGDDPAYQVFVPMTTAPLLGRDGTLGTLTRSALRFFRRQPDGTYAIKAPFGAGFTQANESDTATLRHTAQQQGITVSPDVLRGVFDPLKSLDPAMGLPQAVPIDKNVAIAREFDELASAAHAAGANLIVIDNSGPMGSSHTAAMTGLVVTEQQFKQLDAIRRQGGDMMQALRGMNLVPWRIATPKPGENPADFEAKAAQVFFGNIDMGAVTQNVVASPRTRGEGSGKTRLVSAVYDAYAMRLVMEQGQYRPVGSGHALRVNHGRLSGIEHGLTV